MLKIYHIEKRKDIKQSSNIIKLLFLTKLNINSNIGNI